VSRRLKLTSIKSSIVFGIREAEAGSGTAQVDGEGFVASAGPKTSHGASARRARFLRPFRKDQDWPLGKTGIPLRGTLPFRPAVDDPQGWSLRIGEPLPLFIEQGFPSARSRSLAGLVPAPAQKADHTTG